MSCYWTDTVGSLLTPKIESLKLFLPFLFPPALQTPATGLMARPPRAHGRRWPLMTQQKGTCRMERKRAQVPCCQQKPSINREQHIKPLPLICCLDLKRLLFSLSSKLQLLTLFLSLYLYWTKAFLLSWRLNSRITCHPSDCSN